MSRKRIVVGMSGGVDSSVSALLLKEQGHDVIGIFMKNWEDEHEDTACTSAADFQDVVSVCERVGIPFYAVNFVNEYREKVFEDFLRESLAGNTPNPDILCNREIKFNVLMDKAQELGADYLATGHYCQTENGVLLKGRDANKDQSYFLHALSNTTLQKVMFPVGGMEKKEVRDLAKKFGLSTAEKKDSTGICFIGERRFREFLSQHLECQPGHFETLEGKVVGKHQGVAYYTIGQRKGMGIGGEGEAWFVVGKDVIRRIVYVVQGTRHPALFCDGLQAKSLTWVSGIPPQGYPYRCKSKIRYRQPDQECVIEKIEEGIATVKFDIPQRAVTPGQSIVFYDGNICLGGGIISIAEPSYYQRGVPLPEDLSP